MRKIVVLLIILLTPCLAHAGVATVNGIAIANLATYNGVTKASLSSIMGELIGSTTVGPLSIAADTDDGHGRGVYFNSNSTWVGQYDSTYETAYFWFDNVTVPNGATIVSASIAGKFDSGSSGTPADVEVVIGASAEDDATKPSAAGTLPQDMTLTTAQVSWDVGSEYVVDATFSKSITSVIQEIVNRGGWVSGNAMCILIRGVSPTPDNTDLQFYEYSDSAACCALTLTVEYTSP